MSWLDAYKGNDLPHFLDCLTSEGWFWAVKRLSGNDTGLTGGHQVGLYLPKWFFQNVFPEICVKTDHNPKAQIESFFFPSHDVEIRGVTATYYNTKHFPELGLKKPYDEFRLTRFGGKENPLQQHDNTGSIVVIACRVSAGVRYGLAWCATSVEEETAIEQWVGSDVQPGEVIGSRNAEMPSGPKDVTRLAIENLPEEWLREFPTGTQMFDAVRKILPHDRTVGSLDSLLLQRRALEYALFEEIEKRHVLPQINKGFNTVDAFMSLALSLANRRKSRTGRSLELNLGTIFRDVGLRFEEQVKTEREKRPDFLFPSARDYHDDSFPLQKLYMLGAKTCCKERWAQILAEADRIKTKHLFTLQEGVSENQLAEMKQCGVVLVVPSPNKKCFPKEWRSSLLDLQGFVDTVTVSQRS